METDRNSACWFGVDAQNRTLRQRGLRQDFKKLRSFSTAHGSVQRGPWFGHSTRLPAIRNSSRVRAPRCVGD